MSTLTDLLELSVSFQIISFAVRFDDPVFLTKVDQVQVGFFVCAKYYHPLDMARCLVRNYLLKLMEKLSGGTR